MSYTRLKIRVSKPENAGSKTNSSHNSSQPCPPPVPSATPLPERPNDEDDEAWPQAETIRHELGETIPGLAKDPDGRWRLTATRQRFSDPDEHTAVARFRQWEREHAPDRPAVFIPVERSVDLFDHTEVGDKITAGSTLLYIEHDDGELETGYDVDERVLWAYVRKQLLADPVDVARKVGIPQLANACCAAAGL